MKKVHISLNEADWRLLLWKEKLQYNPAERIAGTFLAIDSDIVIEKDRRTKN